MLTVNSDHRFTHTVTSVCASHCGDDSELDLAISINVSTTLEASSTDSMH